MEQLYAIMPNIHPSSTCKAGKKNRSSLIYLPPLSIVNMHLVNRDTSWLTRHSFNWAGPVTVSSELVGQGQVMVNSTLAVARDRLSLPKQTGANEIQILLDVEGVGPNMETS